MNWPQRARRALQTRAFAAPASVAVLAFLASVTSLVNGFVYDDGPIVATNARVHSLARPWEIFLQPYWPPGWGDANYRPLTILSLAVQWALGDGSAAVFHATNVALYLATCLAVLSLAKLVLPPAAAWLTAALFAVHPVHVEAVGNVVGQAEIVVALCSTLAAAAYIRFRTADCRPARPAATIGILYVIACLSKETGFFLPGLLLAAEGTVVGARLTRERRSLRARSREVWAVYVTCAAVGIAYLAARRSILGDLGDDPNPVIAVLSHKARLLTMLGVVPEWARLFLWPARLAADYSPREISIFLVWTPALLAAVGILIACVVLCVAGWRGPRVGAFGIVWAAVALFPVSNLFVRSGVILAERTLFLPSVGILVAVGAALATASARVAARFPSKVEGARTPPWRLWSRAATVGVALILTLGVVKSARRQRVWRSSDEFFQSVVDDAPLGYRAHYMHGMWLFEKGRRAEGERHVRAAIALFPYDAAPYTDLADQYRKSGLCAPARQLYRRALTVGSVRAEPRLGLVACLIQDGEFAEARAEARRGVEQGGMTEPQFRRLIAIADSAIAARPVGVTLSGTPRTGPGQKGPRN